MNREKEHERNLEKEIEKENIVRRKKEIVRVRKVGMHR